MGDVATNENIKYIVLSDECNHDTDSFVLNEMMKEFESMDMDLDSHLKSSSTQDELYAQMANYDMNYNAKQLIVICEYYGLGKMVKWKKADIISSIVSFENNPEHYEVVERRIKLWKYMEELKQDAFMKKFIVLW
ncbi:MAG: hypothetical protein EBU01_16185 [Crocinitomicaceae bacterium]|nr:hypothetical protein [Crocinitomicaceae bacterium]